MANKYLDLAGLQELVAKLKEYIDASIPSSTSGFKQFFYDTITNSGSDWNNRRVSEFKVTGSGLVTISVSLIQKNYASYGHIDVGILHSSDNGSTWTLDSYYSRRHDQSFDNAKDAANASFSYVASDGDIFRVTWYLSKDDARVTRISVVGSSNLQITKTLDGVVKNIAIEV